MDEALEFMSTTYEEVIGILANQISRRNALITELCDAMERMPVLGFTPPDRELIQRGREATR